MVADDPPTQLVKRMLLVLVIEVLAPLIRTPSELPPLPLPPVQFAKEIPPVLAETIEALLKETPAFNELDAAFPPAQFKKVIEPLPVERI